MQWLIQQCLEVTLLSHFVSSLLLASLLAATPFIHGGMEGGRVAGGTSVRIPLELPKKSTEAPGAQATNVLVGRVLSVHHGDTITVAM